MASLKIKHNAHIITSGQSFCFGSPYFVADSDDKNHLRESAEHQLIGTLLCSRVGTKFLLQCGFTVTQYGSLRHHLNGDGRCPLFKDKPTQEGALISRWPSGQGNPCGKGHQFLMENMEEDVDAWMVARWNLSEGKTPYG